MWNTIVWQGTVDNLALSGIANGNKQPMRVVADPDGRLMTEFAASRYTDESRTEVEYDENQWIADTSMPFRSMEPELCGELEMKMIGQGLLEESKG